LDQSTPFIGGAQLTVGQIPQHFQDRAFYHDPLLVSHAQHVQTVQARSKKFASDSQSKHGLISESETI